MSVPPNLRVMHIGRKIQRMRELRGMKQETMAGKLGLTQQAVSYIEQSDTIEDEKLERIAEALEVSADEIRSFNEDAVIHNIQNNYEQSNNTIINNQFNPMDKLIQLIEENRKLYERLLKEKDDVIETLRKNQKAS